MKPPFLIHGTDLRSFQGGKPMSEKRCVVTCTGSSWEVLFVDSDQTHRSSFRTQTQAMLAANEWTWSERHKGIPSTSS